MEKAEIKEFRVITLNPSQKFVEISVAFTSKINGKVSKRLKFDDTPIAFTDSLLEEVKKASGAEQIEKQPEMKDKIANIVMRLSQEIKDLAKIREHEQFMKAYNRLNCYKVSFPDVSM